MGMKFNENQGSALRKNKRFFRVISIVLMCMLLFSSLGLQQTYVHAEEGTETTEVSPSVENAEIDTSQTGSDSGDIGIEDSSSLEAPAENNQDTTLEVTGDSSVEQGEEISDSVKEASDSISESLKDKKKQVRRVSGNAVAADGTYTSPITATKTKDNEPKLQ